jgi:hypothetical protein
MDAGERYQYSYRGCFVSMLLIIVAVFVIMTLIMLRTDYVCTRQAGLWTHVYPGATVVEESYSYLQMWGIGDSVRVLTSDEAATRVRMWYVDQDTEVSKATGKSRIGTLGTFATRISDNPDGSLIVQSFECVPEFDFSPYGIGGGGQ